MKKWSVKIFGFAAVAATFLLIIGQAGAFKQEDVDTLMDTNVCLNCDLSGANLFGERLSRAKLSGANLSKAVLRLANLIGTDMSRADLTDAKLDRAILSGATLQGATLQGADLSEAILQGATWTDGRICAAGSIGKCN